MKYQKTIQQLFKYAFSGIITTVFHLVIFNILLETLFKTALFSNTIAFIFSTPLSYLLHFNITFNSQTKDKQLLSKNLVRKFYASALFSLLLNNLWAWLFIDYFKMEQIYYQFSLFCITPLLIFVILKFYVFE